ncbi:CKLF-like MARVEL transmembrane domain-containing protein 4 [Neocloeon triangulifer]|uniref:CKLF-like MARVEL transmembrane domain-containing protein 4 n=1 Tax=Neocloeon triangulifer TaxID=2078957 RepID=UPI00286F809E|nr:CKLF-like MARVEL transmembrane domain-containing protein 4 [Neocloeon triangulifer]
MDDAAFPGQHTTTTRVTTSNTVVQTDLRYDPFYLRTLPGLVKIVQLASNILSFFCILLSSYSHLSRAVFFKTLAGIGFWFTGILLLFYIFHVIEKFFRIPWLKIEFGFCLLWCLLYLVGASLCVDYASIDSAFGAAAFFGFCASIGYGFDAYLKLQAVRHGELAQGERVMVTKQTRMTVSSA